MNLFFFHNENILILLLGTSLSSSQPVRIFMKPLSSRPIFKYPDRTRAPGSSYAPSMQVITGEWYSRRDQLTYLTSLLLERQKTD